MHTALWTRSPLISGLQLADYWAWLRYGAAVGNTPDLRLRSEWDEIDPHQKTVLSDELGVGTTTYLLADVLQYQRFVDTHYVVRHGTPATIKLAKSAKRGPSKAPDYIAIDRTGGFVALECKGTQSSVAALESAMTTGIGQKTNASGSGKSILKMGLVGGLFIPQHKNKESASILFWDPTWKEFSQILDSMSADELRRAVFRGSLAKQLAFAGATTAAKELASVSLDAPLSDRSAEEVRTLARPRVALDTQPARSAGARIPLAVLSASLSKASINALLSSDPVGAFLDTPRSVWEHGEQANTTTMKSPDGFTFSLSVGDKLQV